MNIEDLVRKQILDYLIDDGCSKSAVHQAADKGVELFNQCNHKDPFFDSLCHAGLIFAQHYDKDYKLKKPKKATGKPFVYGKPKSRKHPKKQPYYDRLNLEESEYHVINQFNSMKAVKGAFQFGLCVLVISIPAYLWIVS